MKGCQANFLRPVYSRFLSVRIKAYQSNLMCRNQGESGHLIMYENIVASIKLMLMAYFEQEASCNPPESKS